MRLRSKLTVFVLVLVFVGAGATILVSHLAARDSFRAFVSQADLSTAEGLAETIGRYYEEVGNWSAVADRLTSGASGRMGRMMESMMGRSPMMMGPMMMPVDEAPLVVLSPEGRPLLDLRSEEATANLDGLSPTDGVPVLAATRRVGYLFFGSMIDGNLTAIQADFLGSTLTATIFSAIAVAATAFLLGWIFLRRLTLPLAELVDAAQSISRGNLAHEIAPRGNNDEIGELASAFRDMRESLARSEDARRRMLRDLAHEIRTPVTLLAGELEAIRDGVYKADKGSLDSLHQEVTLLATLVEDLSVLASADAKELELDSTALNARQILETAARRAGSEARSAGTRLDVDAPEGLLVEADDTRIQQVLSNLIGNSLRHGGSVSRIRLSAHRDTERTVEFRVADDGKGVDEEDLPFLFDRLYRTERSRSRGGSGLGLSISKSIIEAHDGQIRAFSAESGGLVVAFWLRERP